MDKKTIVLAEGEDIRTIKAADMILKEGIADLINNPRDINRDFADVKTVMQDKGVAHIGIGSATGDDKALEAVKIAVASPLLETTINNATDVIINISGDVSLMEANDAADFVRDLTGDDTNIIFGAVYDDSVADFASITVIATGLEDTNINNAMAGFSARSVTPSVRAASAPQYTYSGTQSTAASSTASFTTSSSTEPVPGLKTPGEVTSSKVEKGISIPTFLQKNRR